MQIWRGHFCRTNSRMKVLQTVWSERQNVPDNVFHLLYFAIQRDIVAPKPEGQTVKKSRVS